MLDDEELMAEIGKIEGKIKFMADRRAGQTARLFERDRAAYMETEDPRVQKICMSTIGRKTIRPEAAA
jgi:hypothetical protein